jgi:hypothetical protein
MELFAVIYVLVQLALGCFAVVLDRAATRNWTQSVERMERVTRPSQGLEKPAYEEHEVPRRRAA